MSNYLVHVLSRLKARGLVPTGFIDAGAHFGETIDMIRAVYPDANILSFEANPKCEEAIRAKRVNYAICLLGSESGDVKSFYVDHNDPTSTGCSIYREKSKHFENADVINLDTYRLDDIMENYPNYNFLKMDVQGAELDIMKGADNVLSKARWVYAEVSFVSFNEGAPLFDDINDYLRSKGYSIVDLCDPTYVDNKLLQGNFLWEKIR
jgi:FkbM family methyltransferase